MVLEVDRCTPHGASARRLLTRQHAASIPATPRAPAAHVNTPTSDEPSALPTYTLGLSAQVLLQLQHRVLPPQPEVACQPASRRQPVNLACAAARWWLLVCCVNLECVGDDGRLLLHSLCRRLHHCQKCCLDVIPGLGTHLQEGSGMRRRAAPRSDRFLLKITVVPPFISGNTTRYRLVLHMFSKDIRFNQQQLQACCNIQV